MIEVNPLIVIFSLSAGFVLSFVFALNAFKRKPKANIFDGGCVKAHEKLTQHNEEFQKGIFQVVPRVHVAIGYGLANSILIEGDNGVIVVDTLESCEPVEELMVDYQKICSKPIVAAIYTHNHTDHIGGTRAFMKYSRTGSIDIYAQDKAPALIKGFMSTTGPIGFMRSSRQFGQFLPSSQHINSGIGPCLCYQQETVPDFILPTITFSKQLDVTIEGISLQLIHAPGETDDQLVVYLTADRLLCAADNIYKAFPNLYAIRGTPTRDAHQWADSLKKMADLRAEHLVPSHTRPLSGEQVIFETLETYRRAILFVHDQTVRLMNRGYFIEDIVTRIRLPSHLANHPYLQEFYGTVAWGVRGVFNRYLGWFGGDPALLHPLPPRHQALRMIQLAGGASLLLDSARRALEVDGDDQWGLLCAQCVLRAAASRSNQSEEMKSHHQLTGETLNQETEDVLGYELPDPTWLKKKKQSTNTSTSATATPSNDDDSTIKNNHNPSSSSPSPSSISSSQLTLARQLAVDCLRSLAEKEVSANGRNYYLTYAMELGEGVSLFPSSTQIHGIVRCMGVVDTLYLLPTRLNPSNCIDLSASVLIVFPDLNRQVLISIRKGIAFVEEIDHTLTTTSSTTLPLTPSPTPPTPSDLIVTVNSQVFSEIITKDRNKTTSFLSGELNIQRGLMKESKNNTHSTTTTASLDEVSSTFASDRPLSLAFKQFMDCFDDSDLLFSAPY